MRSGSILLSLFIFKCGCFYFKMLSFISPTPQYPSLFKLSRNLHNKVFSGQLVFFSFFEAVLQHRPGFLFNFLFRAIYFFETHFLFLYNKQTALHLGRLSFLVFACKTQNLGPISMFFLLNVFNSTYSRAFFFPQLVVQTFNSIYKQLNRWFISLSFGYSCSLFLIGLGYKLFFYKNAFFIKLGYCKVIQFSVPSSIQVFAKKRSKVRLFAKDPIILGNFISIFFKLRAFNFYKGKGLYFLPTFGAIKLKKGKQQQF